MSQHLLDSRSDGEDFDPVDLQYQELVDRARKTDPDTGVPLWDCTAMTEADFEFLCSPGMQEGCHWNGGIDIMGWRDTTSPRQRCAATLRLVNYGTVEQPMFFAVRHDPDAANDIGVDYPYKECPLRSTNGIAAIAETQALFMADVKASRAKRLDIEGLGL